MAVQIRLQKHGRKNLSFFHVVACDSRSPRDGKFIERLGYYDPRSNPSKWVLRTDRIQYWYQNGAQLSTAVATMLKKEKVPLSRQLAK